MVHPTYAIPLNNNEKNVTEKSISIPAEEAAKQKDHEKQSSTEREKYRPMDLISLQLSMLKAQMNFNVPNQTIQSEFFGWPLMLKPIWYDVRTRTFDGQKILKGILLLGNPCVMWVGVLAVIICCFSLKKKLEKRSLFIVWMYLGCLLCWILIPRKITYFYYYFPSAMILGPAIVFAMNYLKTSKWTSLALLGYVFAIFFFFYPVISFQEIDENAYRLRIWMNSWDIGALF